MKYFKTIINLKNDYLAKHHYNVSQYAKLIADYFCPDPELINSIIFASKIHDIGKIVISDQILNKPKELEQHEWVIMKQHPVTGAELFILRNKYKDITSISHKQNIVEAIMHHHERWDGYGYPNGLRKTEIPLTARIMSVADAYDAMTTLRPYKPALSTPEAINILLNNKEKQFDPDIVDVFINQLQKSSVKSSLLGIGT